MGEESCPAFSRDEMVEDARALADTLEKTHPDPYSGHGGRVDFHRHFEEAIRSIPDDGESIERFYWRIQRLAASIRDGHTTIVTPDTLDNDVDGRFPIGFRVIGTELYIDTVYDDVHTDLLGGHLTAVNKVPLSDLIERQALLESADNVYGDLLGVGSKLEGETTAIEHLLDAPAGMPVLTVETPEGTTEERTVEQTNTDEPIEKLTTSVERPATNGEPAYRFLDDDRSTAFLVLPDCHSHREVHEIARSIGGEMEDFYDTQDAYRRLVGEPVPENADDALSELPAATEILGDLAKEMADASTETLVIDTRGNNGGSSFLAYLLVYILYGYDGIAEAVHDSFSISKISELYRQQRDAEESVDESMNATGFDFTSYFDDTESGREVLEQFTDKSPTFAAEVESSEFAGCYCPETTIMVTSAETFSV